MRWDDDDDDFADNFFAGEHNCAIYEWNSSFIAPIIHDLFYNIKKAILILYFLKSVMHTSVQTTVYIFQFNKSVSMTASDENQNMIEKHLIFKTNKKQQLRIRIEYQNG